MTAFQGQNRQEIRALIGRNIGDVIISTAKSTVDTSSLIDSYGLNRGGDDEYNGRQVIIYDAAGSIVDGEKSFVNDFAIGTFDATMSPVFTAAITNLDKYEMWRVFRVEEINDLINQAIIEISQSAQRIKQTETCATERDKYLYDCLSGFTALHKVEYVSTTEIYKDLHMCNEVWDEIVDSDVTASLDTTFYREGSGCLKLVVAATASANDILATDVISSTDISQCDSLEFSIHSSVALTAGQLQILLDNTAECASAVETLNVPITSANAWTRHTVALANPGSDTAIISIGLKYVADLGACTIYLDNIRAVHKLSRRYSNIPPEYWRIARGATNYLELTDSGKSLAGDNNILRLTGYQSPALLSDDTTDAEVDPAYLINSVSAMCLLNHFKAKNLDIDNRTDLGKFYAAKAEMMKPSLRTNYLPNTRVI